MVAGDVRSSSRNVVCWAACRDSQTCEESEGCGVMTRAFLTFLGAYPEATAACFILRNECISRIIKFDSKSKQTPKQLVKSC
jgi:hypothetical protein